MTENQSKQIEKVENEHVSASYIKEEGCKVILDVIVHAKAATACYEKAVKNVKKEVSIPGFRKGKVPDDMVLKNFVTAIDREFKDLLSRMALQESISLCKLNPLTQSSVRKVQIKRCAKEGAEIHFEYECEPTIPEIDYSVLSTRSIQPKAILEDNVDHELKRHLIHSATFEEITDRPVQHGDFIEIDVDIIESPATNLFSGRMFHVLPDEMPEWCYNLVIGMNLNESKEVTVDPDFSDKRDSFFPTGYEPAEAPMQQKQCRVLVSAIKKACLPEINDEFAKKYHAASVPELRQKIRAFLENEALRTAGEISRSQLAEELLRKFVIDLPGSLLQSESQGRYRYVKEIYTQKFGALPNDKNRDDELKASTYFTAKNFLTLMYLLNAIAQKITVSITSEELLQEISYESVHVPPEQRIIFPNMAPEEARQRLSMRIIMRHALDFILKELEKCPKEVK